MSKHRTAHTVAFKRCDTLGWQLAQVVPEA